MNATLRQRNEDLRQLQGRLPGSLPYDNVRPINVPARCDGKSLFECLIMVYPQVSEAEWNLWFSEGHILFGDVPADPNVRVRGGQQFSHLFPNTTEPDVDAAIEVVTENTAFIVVQKPAPLPVHPCGRFNLNTLTSLLSTVYPQDELRLVHRLDANTTGLMVLARTRAVATDLRQQFELNKVQKQYLVCCSSHPLTDEFVCDEPIAKETVAGGTRELRQDGRESRTRFRVLEKCADGKAFLHAFPETGRTNQIRVHLWGMGLPVLGDPTYLADGQRMANQALTLADRPMCLHAQRLSFTHPRTGAALHFQASDPVWAGEPGTSSSFQ
jgi:RluA family pseudouridine synthase